MILSAMLFAIAANSDNLSVGISYGIKGRHIQWWHNVTIAMITTMLTLVSLSIAHVLRQYLFPNTPSWLGGALLMLLAGWSAFKQPPQADLGVNRDLTTLGESVYLAMTLSINNVGLALAGGLGDLSYSAVSLAIFGFSIAMLSAGQLVGFKLVEAGGLLSHPLLGNGVLFLAGIMMLAGL